MATLDWGLIDRGQGLGLSKNRAKTRQRLGRNSGYLVMTSSMSCSRDKCVVRYSKVSTPDSAFYKQK